MKAAWGLPITLFAVAVVALIAPTGTASAAPANGTAELHGTVNVNGIAVAANGTWDGPGVCPGCAG